MYLSEKVICLEIRKGNDKAKVLRLVAPLFKRDPELGMQLMNAVYLFSSLFCVFFSFLVRFKLFVSFHLFLH
jgi:hypothetical protein